MKEIIKNYLEEHCKVDTYLAEKYKDNLIGGCIEYINKMAREELSGKNGAPYEMVDVYNDMVACKEMIDKLAYAIKAKL